LITTTQFGRVWLARMIVALLIGALLLGEPRKQASSAIGDGAGAILSALLLAAVAFAGHASAADGPAFVLQVCVDALHLLATGLWLGGLAPIFQSGARQRGAADRERLLQRLEFRRRFCAALRHRLRPMAARQARAIFAAAFPGRGQPVAAQSRAGGKPDTDARG